MTIKNNLEKFEQEYTREIESLRTLRFASVQAPEFKIPGYTFLYKKALSLAFAVPAVAFVFAFFFYIGQVSKNNSDLAQIEASNNRILNQINTLDYENNL
jgi:hypothetical protein